MTLQICYMFLVTYNMWFIHYADVSKIQLDEALGKGFDWKRTLKRSSHSFLVQIYLLSEVDN